jgi:hypothetical protein
LIAALYVDANGPYMRRPDVDAWPIKRDAFGYSGPWPVVAHPPCSRWCGLAKLVQARWGHRVGDDGGTFAHALAMVRRWGGVLEHPAFSMAWKAYGLTPPRRGQWLEHAPGQWVTEVSQAAYGHPATKRTWLFCVSEIQPRPLDWTKVRGAMVVGHCVRSADGRIWRDNRKRISKKAASATPPRFLAELLALARESRPAPQRLAMGGAA